MQPMNLEQAIHAHWAVDAELDALLPVDRLTTGRGGTAAPHATLLIRAVRSTLPTNQGPALSEMAVRVTVWHDRYADAKMIVERIRERFDGASLALSPSGRIARLCHEADSIRQHDDGHWQWTIDFKAKVCRLPQQPAEQA